LRAGLRRGQTLIDSYGCGACHQIKQVAPPLTEYHKRQFIAGNLPNTPENLTAWIVDPQVIEPGTAMPDLGITHEETLNVMAGKSAGCWEK